MGRLRTLTTLLILGAGGAATDGATPGAAPPAATATRPPAPVPPVKYLEAGARLFNNGQYALAGKYLSAAQTYRDQLTVSEQTVLDAYLKEMSRVPTDGDVAAAAATSPPQAQSTAPAAPPSTDASPSATATIPSAVPSAPADQAPSTPPGAPMPPTAAPAPAQPPSAAPLPSPGTDPRTTSTDTKQTARWMLQSAREQIGLGNYDDAEKLVSQARGMNIKWGLFDDTPTKVSEALEKARPKAVVATSDASQSHTRAAAISKLKEGRALLANNQYDQAEALANEVKTWGLSYGMFGENPDKVASAARALRRRDEIRSGKSKDQASQGVYEVLVQESRQLMSKGQYDQAEVKARQAQRMNVFPSLTADRAETVLHDLAMARASRPAASPATAVASLPAVLADEPASAVAERDANALVAKGDTEGAAGKFSEVERLRAKESGLLAASSPSDPAVRRVEGDAAVVGLTAPDAPAPAQPVNRAEQLLAEARSLYSSGNYPAARQTALEAKASGGVDTQADDLVAQIALAEQGGVMSLYESALDAVRKGDNPRAHALLVEITASGGADESLQRKAQDLLAKLPPEGTGRATATDLPLAMDPEALAAQKLNAEVGTKIAEARRLQEIDPDKAIGIYEQTLKGVKVAEIPDSARRTMTRRLEVAIELARKDKVTFEAKMKDKAFKAEIENKRLRILEADQAKKARFKDLMDKAMGAYAEGKYNEAEAFAMRAGEIDPNDVTPPALVYKSRYERRFKRDNEIKTLKEDGAVVALQEADAASIADPEVQMRGIRYPKDFKDLTRERRRINAMLEPKRDPKTLAIEAKLKDQVSLNIKDQPLAEAIGFLANYTGINIILDPKALADVDITTSTPVTMVTTTPISLKAALKLILRPLGLNYRVDDEVLLITSPQSMQTETYAQTYYVGDLILTPSQLDPNNPMDSTNPTAKHRSSNPMQAMQTMSSANGATSVVNNGATASAAARPHLDMTPLIQLITASIAPGTWKVHDPSGGDVSSAYGMGGGFGGADAGGLDTATPIGSITPFFLSISLIIRHTAEIHDQIADLLRQLRRLQDLQVSIEVRFITLNDSFFEQIGVDFDFDIHSKTVGKKSTFAIPNPSQSLFPIGGVLGGTANTTGGTTANTGGIGATSGGGVGGSSGTGAIGGGGGSTGALGGTGGGLGGIAGGTTSGGGGATAGGTTGGVGNNPVYIVNPFRDYSLGNKLPVTVGTNGPGIGNFTSDLVVPFQQGPYQSLIAPSNATSSNAGATFGISFLSDLEVYLFLTAAQGDTRTNVLQAPKVTTFNGAPAFLTNTQMINYVAELLPIVGPGSVAFFPQVGSFPNGVQLQVTPVVSADRRYVRMTLSPTFTVLNNFTTISIPAAVGGSGLGGSGAPISGSIQLPNFSLTTISTTVTVPDGGTVLMGGVKRLTEERKEFGVPVLSKTPLLNRLFRNIGIGRTTSSLMMMVTPRIIILEEEEERLGIPTVVQ